MRFADRFAIITAAASGIGRATADIMACEGAIDILVNAVGGSTIIPHPGAEMLH